jgi:hypothetical protein
MIDIKMSELTGAIADKALIRLVDKSVRRNALKMMGQDVRRMMRRSIKASRPGADGRFRSSRPGSRPFYRKHQGKSKEANQFVGGKYLIYRYDEATESVVVGPRALTRSSRPMPETLEFGGNNTTNVYAWSAARFRRVGDGGEIRYGADVPRPGKTTKNTATVRGNEVVTYIKLRTQSQANRANRINRFLHLPPGASPPPPDGKIKTRVAARPYVRPTLREFAQSGKASELLAKAIQRSPLLSGGRR